MTSPSDILLTDRTTIETDWLCGMRYWWYKQEGGTGIVPAHEADYFKQGRDIHLDLASIAEKVPWQDVLAAIPDPAPNQTDQEIWQRRRGWVTAFGMYIWPRMIADYEVVFTERELVLDRTPLWVAVTPDLGLRGINKNLLDIYGKIVYRDYKTAKWTNAGWQNHWPFAVQMHLGIAAMGEELGEKVAWGNIVGLAKGMDNRGRLAHPYVWAYRSSTGEWSPDWHRDWDHAPVWEFEGGIEKWVEMLGEEKATALFPFSAPIFLDPRMLERTVQQRIIREREIAAVKVLAQEDEDMRMVHFESRFIHCKPVVGSPCPFLDACFNREVGLDPIGSGLYVPRVPHHDLEIIGTGGD